jgi:hypothetical protein
LAIASSLPKSTFENILNASELNRIAMVFSPLFEIVFCPVYTPCREKLHLNERASAQAALSFEGYSGLRM